MSDFFTRLTPTVPGEPGAFHIPSQGRVVTGFVSGGPSEGVGFPQWGKAIFKGGSISHYFEKANADYVRSLCGRVEHSIDQILLPGNLARCKDCERRYTKALRK
jgi:hypothetical protein